MESGYSIRTEYKGEDLDKYAELIALYTERALGVAEEKGLDTVIPGFFEEEAIRVVFDNETSTVLTRARGQGRIYDVDSNGIAPSSIHYIELVSESEDS